MASYKVVPTRSVERIFVHSPRRQFWVMKHIDGLASDPFPRQTAKLEGGEELYRIRVGDYRVIYGVDREAKVVTIHYVRHRKEVYRKL